MTHQAAIVGGGLAGLLTAAALLGRGVDDIVLLEGSTDPGGIATTIHRDGYSVEPAAGTLRLPHRHLTPLLDRLGVTVAATDPRAVDRFVFTGGRAVRVPASPLVALTPMVGMRARLRAAAEPLVRTMPPAGDESLDSFMRRRFGSDAGKLMAWLMASGLFAGDPTRLSVRAGFPVLAGLESSSGSVLRGGVRMLRGARSAGGSRPAPHAPSGGTSGIGAAARRMLGDRMWTSSPVTAIAAVGDGWRIESDGSEPVMARNVIVTLAPDLAAAVVDDPLAAMLGGWAAEPVVVVGLGGRNEDMPVPTAFGTLTGPDTGLAVRGVLFDSAQTPARAPAGHALMRVIAGGSTYPGMVDWDDVAVTETVVAEASLLVGAALAPSFVEIVRHRRGIPQYRPGHVHRIAAIDRLLAERPGLHLTGWGYHGVGVTQLATDAHRIATVVAGSWRTGRQS